MLRINNDGRATMVDISTIKEAVKVTVNEKLFKAVVLAMVIIAPSIVIASIASYLLHEPLIKTLTVNFFILPCLASLAIYVLYLKTLHQNRMLRGTLKYLKENDI